MNPLSFKDKMAFVSSAKKSSAKVKPQQFAIKDKLLCLPSSQSESSCADDIHSSEFVDTESYTYGGSKSSAKPQLTTQEKLRWLQESRAPPPCSSGCCSTDFHASHSFPARTSSCTFQQHVDDDDEECEGDLSDTESRYADSRASGISDGEDMENALLFRENYGSSGDESDATCIYDGPGYPSQSVLLSLRSSQFQKSYYPHRPSKGMTDAYLSERAMKPDLKAMSDFKCEKSCKDGNCKEKLLVLPMRRLRSFVWLTETGKENSRGGRNVALTKLLEEAHERYLLRAHGNDDGPMDRFVFEIEGVRVCELLYLQAIGVVLSNPKQIWKGWNKLKAKVLHLDPPRRQGRKHYLSKLKPLRRLKFRKALAYMDLTRNSLVGECTSVGAYAECLYLPYRRINHFYAEYEFYCEKKNIPKVEWVSFSTFCRAFTFARKEYNLRFRSDAGGFDTCEICNNADIMIEEKKRAGWSEKQIDIVQDFRRTHLLQQQRERQHLENNMEKARCMDENGKPTTAFLFSDGFTEDKGDTPRWGIKSHGSRYKTTVSSRVIGVEVVCGYLTEYFVYYTDNLVSKGANIMIEVQRQALIDLSERLSTQGFDLPRNLIFQFDNSRENKNKFVFAYISLLVEQGIFDRIEVNFLIVGHTHASIDQFFSVIAKAADRAKFICSPLALEQVIKGALDPATGRKVTVVRQLSVYYNMTEALLPLINDKIKYFGVPHNFLFTKHCGRCIMQYRLFSTNKTWLPKKPDFVNSPADLKNYELFVMTPTQYDSLGGEHAFNDYTDYNRESLTSKITTASLARVANREAVVNHLASLESAAILEAEIRFDNPDRDITYDNIKISNSAKVDLQELLLKNNTPTEGFIIWIRQEDICDLNNVTPLWPSDDILPSQVTIRPVAHDRVAYLDQIKAYIGSRSYAHNVDDLFETRPARTDEGVVDELQMTATQRQKAKNVEKEYKKQLNQAKIAATAASVFQSIFPGQIISMTGRDDIDLSSVSISNDELIFYYERRTEIEALRTLHKEIAGAPTEYKLLPIVRTTDDADVMELQNTRKRRILDDSADLVRGQLSSTIDGFNHRREVISREGLVVDLSIPELRQRLCSVVGCDLCALAQCILCGTPVCESHIRHPDHSSLEIENVEFTPGVRTAIVMARTQGLPTEFRSIVTMTGADTKRFKTILESHAIRLRGRPLWESVVTEYNSTKNEATKQTVESLMTKFAKMKNLRTAASQKWYRDTAALLEAPLRNARNAVDNSAAAAMEEA